MGVDRVFGDRVFLLWVSDGHQDLGKRNWCNHDDFRPTWRSRFDILHSKNQKSRSLSLKSITRKPRSVHLHKAITQGNIISS